MKIDRSVFLLLTGALAAVACGATQTPPPAPPTADPAFPTMKQTPTASATAPPAPVVEAPPAPTPPPTPKPDPKPMANNVEDEKACGHGKKIFNATKPACTDGGPAINCKALGPTYPSKEGCTSGAAAVQICGDYKSAFKPRIAAQMFTCVARLSPEKKCAECNFHTCAYDALMDACPDPTADADCTAIANKCDGLDMARCRAFLSGMTTVGRDSVKACMAKKCDKGLFDCAQEAGSN